MIEQTWMISQKEPTGIASKKENTDSDGASKKNIKDRASRWSSSGVLFCIYKKDKKE
jgi:hypothetical protein